VRVVARWLVVAVVVLHGLLHLLGAAEGLGWADVSQLTTPVGAGMGIAWLATAVLVVATGLLLARSVAWWWLVGAVAVVASQAMIFTSWSDAGAGTVANLILLPAVVYGFASQGPTSYRSEFRRRSQIALTQPIVGTVVTEADLADLPDPVAAYVRQSGALGQPRVGNFHAYISGRIRGGATKPGCHFTASRSTPSVPILCVSSTSTRRCSGSRSMSSTSSPGHRRRCT
jgi:hypothetical protein